MMRRNWTRITAAAALTVAALVSPSVGQNATIDVKLDQPTVTVSPTLWGVFFEEINRGGEGGIWAELVSNNSFEDGPGPGNWTTVTAGDVKGQVTRDETRPLNGYSPRAMKFDITAGGPGRIGLANNGFKGIPVTAGTKYNASLYLTADAAFTGPVTVSLESEDGAVLASATVQGVDKAWEKHAVTLTAEKTDASARLVVSANTPGTFWLDFVSLMPAGGNGFRQDLMQKLIEMKPAFVRFPGGCWVEGDTMRDAFRWKLTIGEPAYRKPTHNLWNYTCTNALGYHEYLMLCEALNAEALYVFNVGMSHKEVVPMDQMGPWVQDALDAIEYAIGPVDSKWGSLRAKAGHPEPFKLKFAQIGNENGGPAYNERYKLFYDAIKERYPELKTIACDWQGKPNSRPIEILDEHYYSTPQFFMANADKYDTYPRDGYKIYVGEYAVTQPDHKPNLIGAIGEAAFMTGMERNSDVVTMTSYAPLFNNVAYTRWSPNAINFDGTRVFGSPSYYVQKMFFNARPDQIVASETKFTEADAPKIAGTVGVGTWLTQAEYKDIKIVENGKTVFSSDLDSRKGGLKADGGVWDAVGSNEKNDAGAWAVKNNALVQTANVEGPFAVLSDKQFTNATLTLKARKTGGEEGFLVRFNSTGPGDYMMWNIGGWRNSRHSVEVAQGGGKSQLMPQVPGKIETGRWYDIKIETTQTDAKCYLDGKLIQTVNYPKARPLYTVAGMTKDEAIVKVVNGSANPQPTVITLAGKGVDGTATVQTLAGEPMDENTLDQPEKIVPKEAEAKVDGGKITHTFPPYSVTVLRVKLK